MNNRSSAHRSIALFVFAMVLATAGCATRLQAVPTNLQGRGEMGTVVIGRVEILRDTGEPYWKAPTFFVTSGDHVTLRVRNEDSGRMYSLTAVEPGPVSDFYVVAPPGRYRVTEVFVSVLNAKVPVAFVVPPAGTVYVGTLRFSGQDASFGARLLGTMARGHWSVEDTSNAVVERFRARHPGMAESVVPSLMRLDMPPREVSGGR